MLQKWSRYRILQEFFDAPTKGFLLRELSRRTRLAQTAVRAHLKALVAERLVVKAAGDTYPVYKGNRDNPRFRLLRAQNVVLRLHKAGVIERLEKRFYPACIVLFGSAGRGEDTESSDIDLFVQAEHAPVDLAPYERLLRRKINIMFEPDMGTLSPELRNNLANGITLYGHFAPL